MGRDVQDVPVAELQEKQREAGIPLDLPEYAET